VIVSYDVAMGDALQCARVGRFQEKKREKKEKEGLFFWFFFFYFW